jgi:hypothetical protein
MQRGIIDNNDVLRIPKKEESSYEKFHHDDMISSYEKFHHDDMISIWGYTHV